ncbi:PIN domain-containing protein [Patescibacteria group bacterium]|nr:PIN domain-containing protein [Patescibacteria group bacterium]
MNEIFIDTSWFKALLDEKDEFHKQALSIFSKLEKDPQTLVTTNYVLDESFTLMRVKCGLERAKQLRDKLVEMGTILKIVRVTTADDVNAWEWFLKEWNKLSFTDCTSFAVMKRLGLKKVATFDGHFSRAGFEIVS